jgi:hypothetical protein
MEEINRLWSDALDWIDRSIAAVRSLPQDTLLESWAACVLATIVFLLAWLYVVRRNRALKRRVTGLTEELAITQKAYQTEVKWRQAADKVFDREPEPHLKEMAERLIRPEA